MAEARMAFPPRWQEFCYRRKGWKQTACFYVAGLIGLRPVPYHSAYRAWMRGHDTFGLMVLAAIPISIFALGFWIGRATP